MFKIGDRVIGINSNTSYEVVDVGYNCIKYQEILNIPTVSSLWIHMTLFKMDDGYYRKLREEKINKLIDD